MPGRAITVPASRLTALETQAEKVEENNIPSGTIVTTDGNSLFAVSSRMGSNYIATQLNPDGTPMLDERGLPRTVVVAAADVTPYNPDTNQGQTISPSAQGDRGSVRQDEGVEEIPAQPTAEAAPEEVKDPSTLDDTQFDAHIDTLTAEQAIPLILARRGEEEADTYTTWRKGQLRNTINTAQRVITTQPKPFDDRRYKTYSERQAAERQYKAKREQSIARARATLDAAEAELQAINTYQIERNRALAAEREAQDPTRQGITAAAEKLPVHTLPAYIARLIATGTRLRFTADYTHGIAAELGIQPGSTEHRELLSILSNAEGMTPEQLAHYITENIEPEYRHLITGSDVNDIRNTIIDVKAK